jgi:hypothetical protein
VQVERRVVGLVREEVLRLGREPGRFARVADRPLDELVEGVDLVGAGRFRKPVRPPPPGSLGAAIAMRASNAAAIAAALPLRETPVTAVARQSRLNRFAPAASFLIASTMRLIPQAQPMSAPLSNS